MKLLFVLSQCFIQINVLHISNGINCERKLYSHMLENFSFQTYFGISWAKCVEICKSIRKCKSVNFVRRSGFCHLNSADQADNPGALKEGVGYMFSPKSEWGFTVPAQCLTCSDYKSCNLSAGNQCNVVGCPAPDPVPGATIFGNLFHVGAKRLYKCDYGSGQEVRICQEDGSWSLISLSCPRGTCTQPEIENANIDVTENDDGITEATISCNTGFFHRSVNKVQCNSDTMEWDRLDEVGCIEISVDSWTKVYRTVSGVKAGKVINSWKNDNNQATGEFRNDEIVSHWQDKNFDRVKVEIIDSDDDNVKYLLFDRTATNNMNWFSRDKILSSSWTDLSKNSNVRFFRINGVKFSATGFLRWVILNAEDESNGRINCTTDLVWFAIAKPDNYPCTPDKELPERVIVYSKSLNGTTWEGGQLGFAKEVIVSVRLN